MNYSKIMALDYGEVRIGVAMTDLMQIIASPYQTYVRKNIDDDLSFLASLAKNNSVSTIVFGLPLNMDGTEGERALKTREFASSLMSLLPGVKLDFQDERLSSVSAEDILIEHNVRRDKRKSIIDKLAATIILESYMSRKK